MKPRSNRSHDDFFIVPASLCNAAGIESRPEVLCVPLGLNGEEAILVAAGLCRQVRRTPSAKRRGMVRKVLLIADKLRIGREFRLILREAMKASDKPSLRPAAEGGAA
jgi:hypothetical protein